MNTTKHTTNEANAQAQHTPGRWTLALHRTNPRNFMKVEARNSLRVICDAFSHSDEDLANAHLIAAAPDLLEACEAAEHWLSEESVKPGEALPEEILRVLRTAIARATARNC